MNAILSYIKEVIKEMQKVSWPKQNELINNTFITIIGTIFISLFIYGADQVVSTILEFIYS
jgi:preprotein translocase subunit SecE